MKHATDQLKQVLSSELAKADTLFSIVVELNATITLDQSWGSWEIFKKSQDIRFSGKGRYDTGIKNVNATNLEMDTANQLITLTLKKPVLSLVEIDEHNTTTHPSTTGLLRFGDIKLTADERQKLTQQMTDQLYQMMLSENLYDQKLADFTKNVEQVVHKTLQYSSFKSYKLLVTFE
jgi:hypothetical protein